MNGTEKLKYLLEAQTKINAKIKELQKAERYRRFGKTVELTKGDHGRSHLWKETYSLKIRKISARVDSENGSFKTIAEDDDLMNIYNHIESVMNDLEKCKNELKKMGVYKNADG